MAEGRTWLGCCCAWVLGSFRDGFQEGKQVFTGMPPSSPAVLGSSPGASHHKDSALCTQHITFPKPCMGSYHKKLQCWAHTVQVHSKTEIQQLKAFCCCSSAEALISALEKGSASLLLLSWIAPVGFQWHSYGNRAALTLSKPGKNPLNTTIWKRREGGSQFYFCAVPSWQKIIHKHSIALASQMKVKKNV